MVTSLVAFVLAVLGALTPLFVQLLERSLLHEPSPRVDLADRHNAELEAAARAVGSNDAGALAALFASRDRRLRLSGIGRTRRDP